MNRDDGDHLIVIAMALAVVGALGAALFWGDPIAAAVLALLAGGAWWLRRFAAAGRRRDAEFEEWRTSPETLAQFLRESGYDEPWEGVQSSGPSLPITLAEPIVSGSWGWPPSDPLEVRTLLRGLPEEAEEDAEFEESGPIVSLPLHTSGRTAWEDAAAAVAPTLPWGLPNEPEAEDPDDAR